MKQNEELHLEKIKCIEEELSLKKNTPKDEKLGSGKSCDVTDNKDQKLDRSEEIRADIETQYKAMIEKLEAQIAEQETEK